MSFFHAEQKGCMVLGLYRKQKPRKGSSIKTVFAMDLDAGDVEY